MNLNNVSIVLGHATSCMQKKAHADKKPHRFGKPVIGVSHLKIL